MAGWFASLGLAKDDEDVAPLDVHAAVHQVPMGRAGRTGAVSHAGLRRLYGRFDKTALALFVLGAPTLSAAWWSLFQVLSRFGQPEVGAEGLIARADDSLLMVPAVWAGLLSAYGLSRFAMHGLLGRRYGAYWLYRRLGLGFDMPRVAKALALFTALLTGLSVTMLARDYTAFTEERIVFQTWGGSHFSQPYSEIAAVRSVPAGEGGLAHYEIEFHDGTVWRSDAGLRHGNPYSDYRYASLAAFMSGRQVVGPDLFDRALLDKGCTGAHG